MKRPITTCLTLLILLLPGQAPAGRPEGDFAWLAAYEGRELTIRPSVNANPYVYVPIVEEFATLEMRGEMFPLMGPEPVTILEVDLDRGKGRVDMKFRSARNEEGRFRFAAPRGSSETMGRQHIEGLLALIDETSGVAPYVLNPTAGTVHFKGSNHCRGLVDAVDCDDPAAASADGYDLCGSCFAPIHLLPDYTKETALGRQVAVAVRSSYPAVTEAAVQARVREAGERVLSRWPLPLRGYRYRFTVVEAAEPNAVACPGGWIFVHDGLLELCESDLELEAILAHEIAHVELRHGLRQMRSAEKAARLGALGGLLAAGVAASQDNADAAALAVGATAIVASLATELALAGYSRDMEMEADAAAVHYLSRSAGAGERTHFARVLAKMEYHQQCETGNLSYFDSFYRHPPNSVRSDFARNAETLFFDEPPVFRFETADGAVFDLEIVGICHHAYFEPDPEIDPEDTHAYEFGAAASRAGGGPRSDTRVFATIRAGSGVERGMEFKDMELQMDGHWVKFDNKEDTNLYPDAETSMVLVRRQKGRVVFDSLMPTRVRYSGRATGGKPRGERDRSAGTGLR